MSTSTRRNPLTEIPRRAARWSATHPWRAILAWLAFVLVAVGLAIAVPTEDTKDSDYRLGESGRAEASSRSRASWTETSSAERSWFGWAADTSSTPSTWRILARS